MMSQQKISWTMISFGNGTSNTGAKSKQLLRLFSLSLLLQILFVPSSKLSAQAFSFSSSSSENNPLNQNKHLTASQIARRQEEQRRQERKNENIPGKTSAIPGAKDYDINVHATEAEWFNQASASERTIREYTTRGMEALKMLRLEEAADAFDTVYKLKPYAYCWQAGVVKFYLGDFREAAECFVHNAALYESKFGQPASEERIWRDACELKVFSSMSRKEKKREQQRRIDELEDTELNSSGDYGGIIAQMRNEAFDQINGPKETRKVIRIARDLFSSSVCDDFSGVALARAKLRSICGEYDLGKKHQPIVVDRKMWKLNSWYYLGLHYDAMGEFEESKACMKMALRQCISSGNGNDIIHTLPILHMARRDWYDDDEFEEDNGEVLLGFNNPLGSEISMTELENPSVGKSTNSIAIDKSAGIENMVVLKSIHDTVAKMKLVELQSSLKKRGLKTSGTKSTLQERLLKSLLEDAGLEL